MSFSIEAERLSTELSCGISDDVIVPIIHEVLRAVDFHIGCFEACSTFTRIAARMDH